MKVVISQPMFFPWVGLFEQIKLADVYVHYGDVAFSKGSFVNRVQIKCSSDTKWLTLPLRAFALGTSIDNISVRDDMWKQSHISLLEQKYQEAPALGAMLKIVRELHQIQSESLGQIARKSILLCKDYLNLNPKLKILESYEISSEGSGSRRVLDIVKRLGGTTYVTGWGARNYLDHELFERSGVRVEYMNYAMTPYPQLHGTFTPYVSILDLIANVGEDGVKYMNSNTTYWKDFKQ